MEAVFSSSSTEFRIRAARGQAADQELADDGLGRREFVSRAPGGFAGRAAASVFYTFFPADCRICGSPLIEVSRLPVCQTCLLAIRALEGAYCTVCGEALHLPPSAECRDENCEEAPARDALCMLCRRARPTFERALAFGSYDRELRDLIHLLKFQQVRPAAAVLGRKLARVMAALEEEIPAGTILVIPVPLYRGKRAQRGFNQAEMISRSALKELPGRGRFDLCTRALLRRRDTGSQIGLTRHQRRENLRGAFVVSDPTRILNRNILLVDDVFTTGTTASECTRVLLRAGAAKVWVATVARTLKNQDVVAGHSPVTRQAGQVSETLAAHG